MKVIDAYWELQNINKKTLEIEFDNNDSSVSLKGLNELLRGYEYVVAKVPQNKLDIVHNLEEQSFSFMEMQLAMEINLIKFKRAFKSTSKMQFILIEKIEDLEEVLAKIDTDLFITDRISLDKAFGIKYAHQRYINWLREGFLSGRGRVYVAIKNDEKIGFSYVSDRNDNILNATIVSVFKEHRRKGLGIIFLREFLNFFSVEGYTKIVTKVSSNNLEALRANLYVGCEIKECQYILRKLL